MKIRINKDVVEFTPEHAAEAAALSSKILRAFLSKMNFVPFFRPNVPFLTPQKKT